MFANAVTLARNFTKPLVISHRKYDGSCAAGMGTYVIINDEGWFVTAFHVIRQITDLSNAQSAYYTLLTDRDKVTNDSNLTGHQKEKRLKQMSISKDAITNSSTWLGEDKWTLNPQYHVLPEIDLAVCKIDNFHKSEIPVYPKFKNPDSKMEPGTSLCKLGYPFYSVTPAFDVSKGFLLPGPMPIPLFPIEGIFARNIVMQAPDSMPHPLMYIETSSPGLRGQSGGPTFDIEGNIWAIQSQTQHYKLDFGDSNFNGSSTEKEHLSNQYFNAGWGIHSKTIVSFLKALNISFELSA